MKVGAFEKKDGQSTFRALGMVGSFGFLIAVSTLLGYYIGHSLDKRFGTDPWFMLFCLLVGVGLGFWEFFRIAKKLF